MLEVVQLRLGHEKHIQNCIQYTSGTARYKGDSIARAHMAGGSVQQSDAIVYGLREQIVKQIRKDIFAGRLGVGKRLSEVDLASRFKVSRTPIREALQQLVQEGVLDAQPNYGVRVAAEACDSMNELVISIRRMIETFALRLCFDDLNEEDFRQWEDILGRLAEACRKRDYREIAELDIEFHRAVVHRAGIPVLDTIWTSIIARIRTHFRETQLNYSDPMDIHAEHAAILEAFRASNRDAATKLLEENIA